MWNRVLVEYLSVPHLAFPYMLRNKKFCYRAHNIPQLFVS